MLPIDPEPLPEPPGGRGDQAAALPQPSASQTGARGLADRGHALFSDSAGQTEPSKAPRQFPGMSEVTAATIPHLVRATNAAMRQFELARRLMVLFDKKPGEGGVAWDQELGIYRKW